MDRHLLPAAATTTPAAAMPSVEKSARPFAGRAMKVASLGLASLALAAMASCTKGGQGSASGGVANAAAPTMTAASGAATGPDTTQPVTLAELPAPTAGEWVLVVTRGGGGAASVSRVCLDGKPINPSQGMAKPCEKLDAVRTADGGFKVTGACTNNGVTTTLLMRGVGDFRKSFYTDTELSTGPGSATTSNSTYNYAGPTCAK
jgi:hypothetical protein